MTHRPLFADDTTGETAPEVETRIHSWIDSGDSGVQANLDQEIIDRQNADQVLQDQIDDSVQDGDPAGGVLSGTYPNPAFAVDMATQAELDAEAATRGNADAVLQANIDAEEARALAAEALLIPLTQKGANNGVATLDGGGKIPLTQLPSSVFIYRGLWNAATNSPTLADGSGSSGDAYRVSVAGTQNLGSGPITFDVGDLVIYDGTVWQKSDSTDAVTSVAGLTGTVTAPDLKTALSLPTDTVGEIGSLDSRVDATETDIGTIETTLGTFGDIVTHDVDEFVSQPAGMDINTADGTALVRMDNTGPINKRVVQIRQDAPQYSMKIDHYGTNGHAVDIASHTLPSDDPDYTVVGISGNNTNFGTLKVVNNAAQTGGAVVAAWGTDATRTAPIYVSDNWGTGDGFQSIHEAGSDAVGFRVVHDGSSTFTKPAVWLPTRNTGGDILWINNTVAQTSGSLVYLQQDHASASAPLIRMAQAGTGYLIDATGDGFAVDGSGFVRTTQLFNITSFNNARLTLGTTGSKVDRNVNDANATLIVQQIHASATGAVLSLLQGGTGFLIDASAKSFAVDNSGFVRATQLFNYTSFNNAKIALNTTGTQITRNVADGSVVLQVKQDNAGGTGDLLNVQTSGNTVRSRFNKAGYFMTSLTSAPADADVGVGEMSLWFDSTNGAAKLMVKAKEAGGTVRTGSVALS